MSRALCALVLASWCGCTEPCQNGTVFLRLTLTGGAQNADTLDVALAVDNQAAQHRLVPRSTPSGTDSLTLAFPGGYPATHAITLTVAALGGGTTLLATTVDHFVAPAGCTLLALTLDGAAQDLAAPIARDLAAPHDLSSTDGGAPSITFVQIAHTDTNTTMPTISATFAKAQLAGDLNVVVVGHGDSANAILSVADTKGNAYVLGAGPTPNTGVVQSIYYAPHILAAAAGGNAVVVTFNAAVTFPSVAIVEYAGVKLPDKSASNSGSTIAASSGPVTTTAAPELVFAAGLPDNSAAANFASGGTGFAVRAITSVAGMLVEDQIVSTIGTYQATGTLTAATPWVMQTVTFK